jgi:hypothetical protein
MIYIYNVLFGLQIGNMSLSYAVYVGFILNFISLSLYLFGNRLNNLNEYKIIHENGEIVKTADGSHYHKFKYDIDNHIEEPGQVLRFVILITCVYLLNFAVDFFHQGLPAFFARLFAIILSCALAIFVLIATNSVFLDNEYREELFSDISSTIGFIFNKLVRNKKQSGEAKQLIRSNAIELIPTLSVRIFMMISHVGLILIMLNFISLAQYFVVLSNEFILTLCFIISFFATLISGIIIYRIIFNISNATITEIEKLLNIKAKILEEEKSLIDKQINEMTNSKNVMMKKMKTINYH